MWRRKTRPDPLFFFFNDTATTEIYTLSLHDALPISGRPRSVGTVRPGGTAADRDPRSEEHTSELQSLRHLVCRLLLEKKKTNYEWRTRLSRCPPTRPLTTTRARH